MIRLILTAVPSPRLVEKVRELYSKRLQDVRFLIPILTGLTQVCLLLRNFKILNLIKQD